jgi:hypothetical protein
VTQERIGHQHYVGGRLTSFNPKGLTNLQAPRNLRPMSLPIRLPMLSNLTINYYSTQSGHTICTFLMHKTFLFEFKSTTHYKSPESSTFQRILDSKIPIALNVPNPDPHDEQRECPLIGKVATQS